MNWIIKFSRGRKGKSMIQNLSQELIDAYNDVGSSAKKKEMILIRWLNQIRLLHILGGNL